MQAVKLVPLSLLLLGHTVAGAQAVGSLGWIVDQHTMARGGSGAIEAVRAIGMELTIVEPEFTVDARYVATRDGSMRVDVSAEGERVFTEALDHGQAWSKQQGPDAPAQPGSAAGAAALRHGVEAPLKLFGLHEMPQRGHRLALTGREPLDGVDYYVIDATLDDGYRTTYYLSPTTWLIERERQYRALHVDVNPAPDWIETLYEDYRRVAGVQYSFRQVERKVATGDVLATNTIRDIQVNPDIDPSWFRSAAPATNAGAR